MISVNNSFDVKKMEEYSEQVKSVWGKTEAWKEFEQKSAGRSKAQEQVLAHDMMDLFREFGEMRDLQPDSEAIQAQVKKLQDFITAHFYNCTKDILRGLGQMYASGGEFTGNIDKAGGAGTAEFTAEAIRIYTE